MTLKIAPTSDGRRQRSERSQVAIVEAALALINEEKTGADRAAGRGSRRREYPLFLSPFRRYGRVISVGG